MGKKPRLTLTFTDEEYERLSRAAALDRRPKRSMAEKVVLAYADMVLRQDGWHMHDMLNNKGKVSE